MLHRISLICLSADSKTHYCFYRHTCSCTPVVWWHARWMADTTLCRATFTTPAMGRVSRRSSCPCPVCRPPSRHTEYSECEAVISTSTVGSSSPSCSSASTWCTGWSTSASQGRSQRISSIWMVNLIKYKYFSKTNYSKVCNLNQLLLLWKSKNKTKRILSDIFIVW